MSDVLCILLVLKTITTYYNMNSEDLETIQDLLLRRGAMCVINGHKMYTEESVIACLKEALQPKENVRPLERFEFRCEQCNTIHKQSGYAVAQLAMGHSLTFTCGCGNRISLGDDDDYKPGWNG